MYNETDEPINSSSLAGKIKQEEKSEKLIHMDQQAGQVNIIQKLDGGYNRYDRWIDA